MSPDVVADAGPLIGLARIGELRLLEELFETVLIPPRVSSELRLEEDRPGSRALRQAVDQGWLKETAPEAESSLRLDSLDPGEAEAILLAQEQNGRFLLIDEARGRRVARRLGLTVIGTGGVLLAAKRHGLCERVAPSLEKLASAGYRLSRDLRAEILRLAGEA